MPKKPVVRTVFLFVISLLVIGGAVYFFGGGKLPFSTVPFLGQQVVYPLTGTLRCEQNGVDDISQNVQTMYLAGNSQYTCNQYQCRINAVVLNGQEIKGGRLFAPSNPILHSDKLTSPLLFYSGNLDLGWKTYSLSSTIVLNYGESATLRVDVADFASRYDAAFKINDNPIVRVFQIRNYPALDAPAFIPSTNGVVGCTKRNTFDDVAAAKEPVQQGVLEQINSAITSIIGTQAAVSPTWRNAQSTLRMGDEFVYISKYIALPAAGNIDPLGAYQGKHVIYLQALRKLVEVKQISTTDGSSYWVPFGQLQSPPNVCGTNEECLATGQNYFCSEYQCRQGQGYCDQLHPAPEPTYSTDGKSKTTYTCENNAVVSHIAQVACSPSYCRQFGQYCDEQVGCKDSLATFCGNGVVDAGENCNSCLKDLLASGDKCDGSGAGGVKKDCSYLNTAKRTFKVDAETNQCVEACKNDEVEKDGICIKGGTLDIFGKIPLFVWILLGSIIIIVALYLTAPKKKGSKKGASK